jgi:hypothetical protein
MQSATWFATTIPERLAAMLHHRKLLNDDFSFPLAHARFIFLVKKIFFGKRKIKFIFFLSTLKLVSSLKPAGEDGNKAHVNKL